MTDGFKYDDFITYLYLIKFFLNEIQIQCNPGCKYTSYRLVCVALQTWFVREIELGEHSVP